MPDKTFLDKLESFNEQLNLTHYWIIFLKYKNNRLKLCYKMITAICLFCILIGAVGIQKSKSIKIQQNWWKILIFTEKTVLSHLLYRIRAVYNIFSVMHQSILNLVSAGHRNRNDKSQFHRETIPFCVMETLSWESSWTKSFV